MTKRTEGTAKVRLAHAWRVSRAFLKDDKSVWSWIANLAIAFIVIKFIVYPALGLIFGASLPVVAVVSSSMDHDSVDGVICGERESRVKDFAAYWEACGAWYEQRGINAEEFQTYPFRNGFNKGDIMVIFGPSRVDIDKGDVLVFNAAQQYPIIHRVVNISTDEQGTFYQTKGDHNSDQIADYVVDSVFGASRCHKNGAPVQCPLGPLVTRSTPGAIALLDEQRVTSEQVIGTAVFKIPLLGWVKIWFTDAISGIMRLF